MSTILASLSCKRLSVSVTAGTSMMKEVMSNSYHLALETPEANLVDGMRWLQGTFGIRLILHR
jgi:hypothetical protein